MSVILYFSFPRSVVVAGPHPLLKNGHEITNCYQLIGFLDRWEKRGGYASGHGRDPNRAGGGRRGPGAGKNLVHTGRGSGGPQIGWANAGG